MVDLVGTTLDRCQILEELGRGGMAIVYRAYQPALERYVAIKVLPPELSFDREFVERFLREARSAARLNHPNIVTIHDVGQTDETYFIVMEYVDGPSLADILQRQAALSPQRVVQIISQVASALDYAHQQGFVHRDVKPANILLGAGQTAKLTDFGIVKTAEGTRLTRTGSLLGTPAYMSPEQAMGREIDFHTDIYSLGTVAYEMLSGRPPFSGDTMAVIHAHAYEPPDLSVLPHNVRSGVGRALAKDPQQRYERAGDLAKALREASAGAAVEPPEPPGQVKRGPTPSRAPALPLWVGGVGIAALGIAAVLVMSGRPTPTPDSTPAYTPEIPRTALMKTPTSVVDTSIPPMPRSALPPFTPTPATETLSAAQREEDLLRTARYRKGNGDVIFAYRIETPPLIDGSLNEWIGQAYEVPYVVYDPDGHRRSRSDLGGHFGVRWDEDHLYIGAEVTDDAHVQIRTGGEIWEGDNVEIQIDADLSGDFSDSDLSSDDGQIGFSAGDFRSHRPEAYIWRPPHQEQAGTMIAVAARQTSSGYILEAAVPWWALGGRPRVEMPVGFCLSVSDNDVPNSAQQQTMISTSPHRKWGDPTTWGTLVLVDWS